MPMGTIVTVIMLIGLIYGSIDLIAKQRAKALTHWLAWPVGGLVFAGGAWNTFWHGLRHFTEFWGIAALLSGVLMMATALNILNVNQFPDWLRTTMPVILIGLLGFFALYATTIYRL